MYNENRTGPAITTGPHRFMSVQTQRRRHQFKSGGADSKSFSLLLHQLLVIFGIYS